MGVGNAPTSTGWSAEIVAGTNTASFDMNGDNAVNSADLTEWLAVAGGINLTSGNSYLLGDANLDGSVDGSDFGAWNGNKFTNTAAWCSGDFNADGSVDGSDFGIWNGHKFTSADGASTVPEPSLGWLGCCLALWVLRGRSQVRIPRADVTFLNGAGVRVRRCRERLGPVLAAAGFSGIRSSGT